MTYGVYDPGLALMMTTQHDARRTERATIPLVVPIVLLSALINLGMLVYFVLT